ncbi:MAG: chemotaxis protein CheC [Oscillospiraceae bacterium]|nr:chemotaxis protein CheC [Oscillospiraceae bacterium]
MPIKDYSDLNDMQMDVLREIGNVGSGNAATALSTMLDKAVNITVPKIKILTFGEVATALGGPENIVVGLLLQLSDDVGGIMMFLLEKDFASSTISTLTGMEMEDFANLDEMGVSVMSEIGNIMAASYVNAISTMTGLTINISVPEIAVDMVGALLSVPAIYFANVSDKIIFIENAFNCDGESLSSHILMIPDVESLQKILTMLGLDL